MDKLDEYGRILRWELSLHTMGALDAVGRDVLDLGRDLSKLSMVIHGPYANLGLKDLSLRAIEKHEAIWHSDCEESKLRIRRFNPNLNHTYMEFAACQIHAGKMKVLTWDLSGDPWILQQLEDLGCAWVEFHSHDKRQDLFVKDSGIHYVDLGRLAKGVVGRYDMIMKGDHEGRKKLYEGCDFDRSYIKEGLDLVLAQSRKVA